METPTHSPAGSASTPQGAGPEGAPYAAHRFSSSAYATDPPEIDILPLHVAGFISSTAGEEQGEKIPLITQISLTDQREQIGHLIGLNKPLAGMRRKLLDARGRILAFIDFPIGGFDIQRVQLLQRQIRPVRPIRLRNVMKPVDDLHAFQVGEFQMAQPSDILLQSAAGAQAVLEKGNMVPFVVGEKFSDGHGLAPLSPIAS